MNFFHNFCSIDFHDGSLNVNIKYFYLNDLIMLWKQDSDYITIIMVCQQLFLIFSLSLSLGFSWVWPSPSRLGQNRLCQDFQTASHRRLPTDDPTAYFWCCWREKHCWWKRPGMNRSHPGPYTCMILQFALLACIRGPWRTPQKTILAYSISSSSWIKPKAKASSTSMSKSYW